MFSKGNFITKVFMFLKVTCFIVNQIFDISYHSQVSFGAHYSYRSCQENVFNFHPYLFSIILQCGCTTYDERSVDFDIISCT